MINADRARILMGYKSGVIKKVLEVIVHHSLSGEDHCEIETEAGSDYSGLEDLLRAYGFVVHGGRGKIFVSWAVPTGGDNNADWRHLTSRITAHDAALDTVGRGKQRKLLNTAYNEIRAESSNGNSYCILDVFGVHSRVIGYVSRVLETDGYKVKLDTDKWRITVSWL